VEQSFEQYKIEIINLSKADRFKEALDLLEESRKIFSKQRQYHAALCYHLASGYYEKGRFNDGKAFLKRIIQEHSSYDWLLALYVKFLIKTGENDKALAILGRYPNDPDSFTEDLKRTPIDSLTAYNIAASYALLGKSDISILYLGAFWFSQDTGLEERFGSVHRDSDFNIMHNDQRYVFVQEMARAQDFDEVATMIAKELERARESTKRFFHQEKSAEDILETLRKIREDIRKVRTVAPILIEIQEQEINYINTLTEVVSGEKEQSLEALEETYNKIARSIEGAKASQTTHRRVKR